MYKQAVTLNQIISVAQQIMHMRGYNAFSYADIANEIGIKKASIHYYFPNKSDLVKEVVVRHRQAFRTELERIDQQASDPVHKLELYTRHFVEVLYQDGQMCLCGILAADFPTLPADIGAEVQGFFADNEAWLVGVLREGRDLKVLEVSEPIELEAQVLLAGIEGGMLVARSFGDVNRFDLLVQRLLKAHFKTPYLITGLP